MVLDRIGMFKINCFGIALRSIIDGFAGAIVFTFLFLNSNYLVGQERIEQIQVIPGELPDPSIIEVEGVYYATGTSGDWAPIYPIYKSTDLQNWTPISHVFKTNPSWTKSSFWAPELYYHNGTFFCYYTARGTDGISKIGVATTKNIEEGFNDHGPIIEWGNEAIDAFVYKEKGTLYITWKAYGLTPEKPVQLLGSKLTPDGLSLTGESFEIITANAQDWEDAMIEGQCIIKKDDYLYMIYSGNGCCGKECNYQVGVARAKTMTGPWEKYDQNPLITSNSSWKCPGHGTVIQSKEKWYYLYHAYNTKGFPTLGRAALLSEMYWDESTKWPYFQVDENTTKGNRYKPDLIDDFDTKTLNPWWMTNLRNNKAEAHLANHQLLLKDNTADTNEIGAVLCGIPNDTEFTLSTEIQNQNGILKGLVLYGNSKNSIGLGTKTGRLVLWQVRSGEYSELNSILLKKGKQVWLKSLVKGFNDISFLYSADGKTWQTMNISNNTNENKIQWWNSGMKIGLQAKAGPQSPNKEAIFESFRVTY